MLKSVSLCLGSVFVLTGIFLLIFTYNNFGLKIFDTTKFNKHRVVLIILDAFRHDYLEIAKLRNIDLPNLNKMAQIGARSMQVVPVFPSETMPNHQTLLTGLYTPYHGITSNTFNDSNMDYKRFAMGDQVSLNDPCWYRGYPDPLWVTCEKNDHCKSGSMLWPNTDAEIDGHVPSRQVSQFTALNQHPNVVYPYERRVDELIGWMTNDLIDFGLLYFDEPDVTSHKYGPLHDNTLKKLKEMDGYIGRLMDGLRKNGLLEVTDLILTGDHGMTDMSEDRVIEIDKYVPPNLYRSTYSHPVGIIYPNEGKLDLVFSLYSNASDHIKVYKRENVPAHLHYSDNVRRISPIVTVVDLGWFVNSSHYNSTVKKGSHGYDPDNADMHSTLIAMGPSFQRKTIHKSHHVDLYPLMAHILGLKTHPHNGSLDRIAPLLTHTALNQWTAIEDRWVYHRTVMVIYLALILQVLTSMVSIVAVFVCLGRRPRAGHHTRMVAKYDPEQAEALITSY